MSGKSILLELDGSAQSRYAAELVWQLAKKHNWSVNAQHVVDSLAAWDFLNFDIAGFIGSVPYFEAHETMRNCLTNIAENLIEAYRGNAAGHDVAGEVFLDDGTTIREICWRAEDHDLVVIGQRATGVSSPEEDKRRMPRRSIAETLAFYCPKPLLVIQDRCELWKRAKLLVCPTANQSEELLVDCITGLAGMGLEVELHVVEVDRQASEESTTIDDSPHVKEYLASLGERLPMAKELARQAHSVKDLHRFFAADAENAGDSLLVLAISSGDGIKTTCFGSPPDSIIRYLNHPAILLWPEVAATESSAGEAVSSTVIRD